MKRTYEQIRKQIAALEREAEALKRAEVDGVIQRIKDAIAAYGLTAADLGFAGPRAGRRGSAPAAASSAKRDRAGKAAGKKVPVKYRDGQGNTWTGRGTQPRWLRAAIAEGRSLDDFRV